MIAYQILLGTVAVAIIAVIVYTIRAAWNNCEHCFEKYEHHGNKVWVRSDLKGLHQDFCLCCSCTRFHPGTTANCRIAQAVYKNCVEYNLVTPMWECPKFLQMWESSKFLQNKVG